MPARAWTFDHLGGPEVLELKEVDDLTPGDDQAVVEIEAIGLNRSDLLFLAGRYIMPPPSPSHLGQEAIGRIVSLGPQSADSRTADNRSPAVGDRVGLLAGRVDFAGMGTYRTRGVYSTAALLPVPEAMTSETAAGLWLAGLTAWGGLHAGGLRQEFGGSVLVTAASSGVGISALQIARARGARTVALTTSPEKVEILSTYADHVVVASSHDETVAQIAEAAGDDGVALAFDPVGYAQAPLLYQVAGTDGQIVYYGIMAGTKAPLDMVSLLRKDLGVHGFTIYRLLRQPALLAQAVSELAALAENEQVAPRIHATLPFASAVEALELMASNQHIGKIVLSTS